MKATTTKRRRTTTRSRSGAVALRTLLAAAVAGMCAFVVAFADAFAVLPSLVARSEQRPSASSFRPLSSSSSSSSAAVDPGTAPVLKSMLKKPSKVLTVGVEYSPEAQGDDDDDDDGDDDGGSLEVLSMRLRQQAKVSFIACGDVASIRQYVAEQETARGNFPGPVPIVYLDDDDDDDASSAVPTMSELSEAGASAVVIDATTTTTDDDEARSAAAAAESAASVGLETIWKVSTAEQALKILESTTVRGGDEADVAFLLDGDGDDPETSSVSGVIEVLPKSCLLIAVLRDPMQEDGAEIEAGKRFKSMGCASVLVRKACVGDEEDVEYASFLVGGMTSKASKEFKFSGLTGSTNGHFGGIQSNSSVKWERTRRLSTESDDDDDETEGDGE